MPSQFRPKNFSVSQQQLDISQQQTISCPVTPPLSSMEQSTQVLPSLVQLTTTTPELPTHDQIEDNLHEWVEEEKAPQKISSKLRLVIILMAIIGLCCAIYFVWLTPATNSSTTPILTQSSVTTTNKSNTSSSTTNTAPNGTIQVYVAGAVQHPGVYTLSSDARIYELLKAAGGPLPDANLVALNLAQKLVDGQEIYVSQIGETPPVVGSTTTTGSTTTNSTNQGQLVNINTASVTDLEQKLHLSAKSAQEIINYRQQHGPFTSVDQLLQVVSKTIYDKIKGLVTV